MTLEFNPSWEAERAAIDAEIELAAQRQEEAREVEEYYRALRETETVYPEDWEPRSEMERRLS